MPLCFCALWVFPIRPSIHTCVHNVRRQQRLGVLKFDAVRHVPTVPGSKPALRRPCRGVAAFLNRPSSPAAHRNAATFAGDGVSDREIARYRGSNGRRDHASGVAHRSAGAFVRLKIPANQPGMGHCALGRCVNIGLHKEEHGPVRKIFQKIFRNLPAAIWGAPARALRLGAGASRSCLKPGKLAEIRPMPVCITNNSGMRPLGAATTKAA